MKLTNSWILHLVNGGYGKWTSYSACSTSCGNGMEFRTRQCDSPQPAYGGKTCNHLGPAREEKTCKIKECPGMEWYSVELLIILQ